MQDVLPTLCWNLKYVVFITHYSRNQFRPISPFPVLFPSFPLDCFRWRKTPGNHQHQLLRLETKMEINISGFRVVCIVGNTTRPVTGLDSTRQVKLGSRAIFFLFLLFSTKVTELFCLVSISLFTISYDSSWLDSTRQIAKSSARLVRKFSSSRPPLLSMVKCQGEGYVFKISYTHIDR